MEKGYPVWKYSFQFNLENIDSNVLRQLYLDLKYICFCPNALKDDSKNSLEMISTLFSWGLLPKEVECASCL